MTPSEVLPKSPSEVPKKALFKGLVCSIVDKQILTIIATIDDVIDSIASFDS